jgi:hypothetical protein
VDNRRTADGHVAPPSTYFDEQTVYAANGSKLGPQLWGEFYAKYYCLNDPSTGDHVQIGRCDDDDEEDEDD